MHLVGRRLITRLTSYRYSSALFPASVRDQRLPCHAMSALLLLEKHALRHRCFYLLDERKQGKIPTLGRCPSVNLRALGPRTIQVTLKTGCTRPDPQDMQIRLLSVPSLVTADWSRLGKAYWGLHLRAPCRQAGTQAGTQACGLPIQKGSSLVHRPVRCYVGCWASSPMRGGS